MVKKSTKRKKVSSDEADTVEEVKKPVKKKQMKQGSIMAAFGKSKAKKVDSSDEDSPVLSKKKSTVISDRKRGLD